MTMRRAFWPALAMFTLLCGDPSLATAQRVAFEGRGDIQLDRRIRDLLAGDYRLVARDTLLARADTIRGPVLIAGATVRLEGVIAGDLLIVDANVFLRPPARVLGNVTNIAGGYYPSEQATITGSVDNHPNAPYDVIRTADVVRIMGVHRRSLLALEGFRGVLIPSYNRVDELTVGLGAGYYLPRAGLVEPLLRGSVSYHTGRGDWAGSGEVALIRGPAAIRLRAERATITNEEWIRGSLLNSTTVLWSGKDYRDYYEADRYSIAFHRAVPVASGEIAPRIMARVEDARPLRARDPWTIRTPDSIRVNPTIDRGRIASGVLGLRADLERPAFTAGFDAEVELAARALGGDFRFARFELTGEWAMQALANHTLAIDLHLQGPLPGTDSLPLQRRSFVGGSGTLYTFEIGEFRGDRVVMVETEYIVPLPVRLPIVSTPTLDFLHHVGMAWNYQEDRRFEQNVGLRLRFPLVYVRVVTNPRDARDDIEFGIGFNLPRRFPWQSGGGL